MGLILIERLFACFCLCWPSAEACHGAVREHGPSQLGGMFISALASTYKHVAPISQNDDSVGVAAALHDGVVTWVPDCSLASFSYLRLVRHFTFIIVGPDQTLVTARP